MKLRLLAAIAALQLSACAIPTPRLDARIAALNAQVGIERQQLSRLADPYRTTPGMDVQVDASAKPLLDTLDKYNKLSADEKLIAMNSYRYGGILGEVWTDCPIFGGRIGISFRQAFNEAFVGAFYIDSFEPWWNTQGLHFRIKNSAALAGMMVVGRPEFCGISGDILPGAAAIAGYTHSALGYAELVPIPNEGLEYRFKTEQPMYFLVDIAVTGWGMTAPIWFKTQLTQGQIHNIVGQEGKVQVADGPVRHYRVSVAYNKAAYLPAGVMVAGPVKIDWKEPPHP